MAWPRVLHGVADYTFSGSFCVLPCFSLLSLGAAASLPVLFILIVHFALYLTLSLSPSLTLYLFFSNLLPLSLSLNLWLPPSFHLFSSIYGQRKKEKRKMKCWRRWVFVVVVFLADSLFFSSSLFGFIYSLIMLQALQSNKKKIRIKYQQKIYDLFLNPFGCNICFTWIFVYFLFSILRSTNIESRIMLLNVLCKHCIGIPYCCNIRE